MVTPIRSRLAMAGVITALFLAVGAAGAGAQTSTTAAPTQTLSPASLNFGPVPVGQVSPARTLIFASDASITVRTVSVTGEFQLTGGSCSAGFVAGPNASCTLIIVFSPRTVADQVGVATVVYNGISRQSALAGVGADATTALTTSTTSSKTTTSARQTTTTISGAATTTGQSSTTAVQTIPSVPETTTSTTPAFPPPSPSGGREITLDATAHGGGRSGPPGIGVTMTGSGYPANDGRALGSRQLAAPPLAQTGGDCGTVYFFLDGRRLGSTHPDAAGEVRRSGISVPGDVDPGRHAVTSSCRTSGRPVLAATEFQVTDVAIHRSALATSMPHVDQVDFGVNALLISAMAVAGLLVLIAFPAELFNTTLEEHYEEVRGWFGLKQRPLGGGRHHGLLLVFFLALSGPLWFAMQAGSHLDPATAVGALGLSLATGVVVLAADMPEVLHVRRRYGERASPVALPGSLVIAIACVVLSRAVHFQPGYFYGLLGGLALSRTLARNESGRLAARSVAFLLFLSLGAWVALQPVSAAAAGTGRTFGTILVENLLGGMFWAALDSLVIAMLPLRLLEGSKVVGWSRTAWAALYGLTLLAFVHILLRPSTGYVSDTSVSPAGVVFGLFVGFAVFSFAFWGYFRFRPSSATPSHTEALAD